MNTFPYFLSIFKLTILINEIIKILKTPKRLFLGSLVLNLLNWQYMNKKKDSSVNIK